MLRKAFGILAVLLVGMAHGQTRPHNFDLLDVRWSVALDAPRVSFVGDVTNTLRANLGAKQIDLDFGSLTIDSITVDGTPTTYAHHDQTLTIELPAAADGVRSSAVRIRYHGQPKAGMYFVPAARAYPAHTPVVYTQGEMVDNRFWLPTYDYPDDKATSEGTIDVPEGWFALSNGALLDQSTKGGRTTFHWKMDKPTATYLISFVAGPYDKGHEEWDGIPVDYYVPTGLLVEGKAAFGGTANIVRVYSQLTGYRYPWVKYSQAAVPDFMFGGMENVTCTTQTINALHPPSTEPIQDSTDLAAHELAHQWFGDLVTCDGWSDAWINEGWATFMPAFYTRATRGEEAFDIARFNIFEGGLAAHRDDPNRPVVWKGYRDALDMFNNFIYPGGASRMFMLMRMLGEARFWKATDAYLEQRKYTSIDTDDFFASFSKATGQDLSQFEKEWFLSPGAPNLTVSRDGSTLVVRQTGPTKFHIDLPVWSLIGDTWIKRNMKLAGERSTLDLGNSAGKPALVDPECWVMANITYDLHETPEERIAVFLAAPNAAEQLRLMSTLDPLGPEQALEIAKRIKSDRVRQRFLGRLQEGAQDYLVELTKSPDRLLAFTALGRLGELKATEAGRARLRQLYESDPNDVIRQRALRILLRVTHDGTLADTAWKTEGFNDGYRQIALDWWSGNEPAKARTRCLEAIAQSLPEPTRVQAIRFLGALRDAPGRREVYNALATVLGEQSFGARMTAITSLAQYGDPKAIPLIEPYEHAELVFFRQVAQGALASLRGR